MLPRPDCGLEAIENTLVALARGHLREHDEHQFIDRVGLIVQPRQAELTLQELYCPRDSTPNVMRALELRFCLQAI